MKAKYFKKLRLKTDYYDVEVTDDLFGIVRAFTRNSHITVLAYNRENACQRAVKRGHGLNHINMYYVTTSNWARFAVKLSSKPVNHRHIVYLGI